MGEKASNVFRHPLKANSRKTAKLLEPKVPGVCNAMDTAMVPRRLRSAMSKRSTHSASPTFPVQKKQRNIVFKSNQPFSSDAKMFSSSKIDFVTKDEEEVAEALTALAALVPTGKATEVAVNRGNDDKDSQLKPSSTLEEASKEIALSHLIPLRESQEETTKAEAPPPDEYVTESQKFDKLASGFAHPYHQNALADEYREEDQNDVANLSNLGAPHKPSSENGSLQGLQLDPLAIHISSNGCWPIEPPQVEGGLESTKQYPGNGTKYTGGEEISTNLRSVLPNNGNGYLTKSSREPAETFAGNHRRSSTASDLLTGKHALESKSGWSSWRRCSAHVYIAHFIQNYQKMENNELSSLLPKPSKYKEDGTCSSGGCPFTQMLPLSNGLGGIAFGGANSPTTERKASNGRFQVSQDGANISLQSPGVNCSSGHGAKSTMQLHIPYLHPQVPQNYAAMPYPYPHGPYTSGHGAGASCQVQIQLSHFVGNAFCGQRTVHAGGAAAKQYLWQSNIAHYRPPLSPMQGLSKWHNGCHHPDPSHSSLTPSSIFPSPSISMGAVVPAEDNHHVMALLPTPSSSRAMQQQNEGRHGNSECSMERSPHLQLLCKVQNT